MNHATETMMALDAIIDFFQEEEDSNYAQPVKEADMPDFEDGHNYSIVEPTPFGDIYGRQI